MPPSLHDFKYDAIFYTNSKKIIGDKDWLRVKALCYQESKFDKEAESSAGAIGLCQLMPETFNWVVKRMKVVTNDIRDPEANIIASLGYIHWIQSQWHRDRTDQEHWELVYASYNAGLGNILKAQKICNNSKLWDQIKSCLSQVTGQKNSQETINYVDKINRWHKKLEQCATKTIQSSIYNNVIKHFYEYCSFIDYFQNWKVKS